MDASMRGTDFAARLGITLAIITLVLFAGGRTRWQDLDRAASQAGVVAEVSAATLPTSYDLIDEAMLNGELDADQALLYRVYALYGDDRLPELYRGQAAEELSAAPLCEAATRWDELRPQTQAALAPLLDLSAGYGAGVEGAPAAPAGCPQ